MRITIHTNSAACDIDTLGAEPKSLTDLFGREYLWQGDRRTGAGRHRCCFPSSAI